MDIETEKQKLERLGNAIRSKHVAILTHNNPDPDSIAAAFGLQLLMKRHFRVDAAIFYGGLIGRAENRAMVRALNIPMRDFKELDLRVYRTTALVDTQPTAGNNQLPARVVPDIVIDHHHPLRKKTLAAAYHDVRDNIGASSTIVLGYLRAAGVKIPKDVATALFYGIKTDTYDLGRDFVQDDIDAYRFLLEKINRHKLRRIEKPLHDQNYYIRMYRALEQVEIAGNALTTVLWELDYPDITAEVADWLYTMQNAKWVLVLGVAGDSVYLSVRTRDRKRDAGRLIRKVVGRRGMAGGHGQIAGGISYPTGQGGDAIRSEVARLKERFFKNVLRSDTFTTTPLITRIADAVD